MKKTYLVPVIAAAAVGLAMFAGDRIGRVIERSPGSVANRSAASDSETSSGNAGAKTPVPVARPASGEPGSGLSSYQAEISAPALGVLAEMERSARDRGEAVLLARVQSERARVLRAAAGLPRTPPVRAERNEP